MGCTPGACHAITAVVALSTLLAAFHHANELQTAFRAAATFARGQSPARRHASLAASDDSAKDAEAMAAQELTAAFADEGDAGWARWFGLNEASDDAYDEDAIKLLLKDAEVLEGQWRFHPAELKLHEAFRRVSGWVSDLEDDKKPQSQRSRASHQAVEVLLRLGHFLEDRGRPAEAVASLRRALNMASTLTPVQHSLAQPSTSDAARSNFVAKMQEQERTDAEALLVRSESDLARALCLAGGRRGDAVQEARAHFLAALSRRPRPAPPLEAKIHADFAECLHREGSLAEAHAGLAATRRLLENAGEDSGWLVTERAALSRRLARLQGAVSHDNGEFADAVRLYGKYLESAPEAQEGLPALIETLQRFEVMQDLALALASLGKLDQAFASMDDIDRLQKTTGDELMMKSHEPGSAIRKFLASDIVEDESLQASVARSRVVRAELVLEGSRVRTQRTPELARKLAEEGVALLRKSAYSAEALENALNTLGNVRMSLGEPSGAQDAYQEAVKLAVMDHGVKSALVAALYHNEASALEGMGKFSEAVKLYKQGLGIQLATLGEANPDSAGSLDSLARVLAKLGRHAEAVEAAQRALKAARAAYPEGHWMRRETAARLKKLSAPMGMSSSHEFLVSAHQVHHITDA